MSEERIDEAPQKFDLVYRGLSHDLAERFGMAGGHPSRRVLKILAILAVTWVPLALLSWMGGHAVGHRVAIPFFHDPEVHVRFLFVLPLLELAQIVVSLSLNVQAAHLQRMGIVSKKDQPGFRAAEAAAIRLRESTSAEIAIFLLAYTVSIVLRDIVGFTEGDSSWERTQGAVTLAGWWHMLVSLPMLYFFLFRWLLVLAVWARFLFLVSRLDLELTPTHPDRTGGLGFLGWGLASFAFVLMAISAVFSAGIAAEILHHGESLNSLKYHVIVFVVTVLFLLHAPLFAFTKKLTRCRFKGLLEFGALVWRHDRAFDEKWIEHTPSEGPNSILGTSDVQSMADIATCYEHVNDMWLIPFDSKAFAVLVLALLIPIAPLLTTVIPLQEIFMKLGELLI